MNVLTCDLFYNGQLVFEDLPMLAIPRVGDTITIPYHLQSEELREATGDTDWDRFSVEAVEYDYSDIGGCEFAVLEGMGINIHITFPCIK